MKTLAQTIGLLLFGLIFNSTIAQEVPSSVLISEDIDRYVKTAIPVTQELDALGIKVDRGANAWSVNEDVKAILSKNGWDYQTFGEKFACITMGYTYLKMIDQIEQMPQDQQQVAEQMRKSYSEQFLKKIHEDDMKLIKSKKQELDSMDWNK